MAVIIQNGPWSGTDNLNLQDTLGIQFSPRAADPTDSNLVEGRVYYKTSTGLRVYNGSSWTTLGAGGGGGVPSWESIYLNDSTFGITSGTWTISQSSANAVITFNKTNVGAGAVLDITNSGTGADIKNGSTWSIAVAAAVGVLELSSGGTINVTAGALSIGKTGTATTLLGTLTVAEAVTLTSGGVTVTSGNLTLSSGNVVLTSGTFTVSAGVSTLISTSNTAPTLLLTNNTASTYGIGGTSTGVVLFRSTSLTTGTLARLQLTEATLNGGFYLDCWDVTAGAAVFSIAEDGIIVIGGAGSGTASLTQTTGDHVLSDGALSVTRVGDDAVTLTVVNNTAATASSVVISGSGTFSGTTTTSFMTVTPSGLTSGTAIYAPTAALTTGKVLQLVAAAQTDGILIDVAGGGANLTSTGRLLKLAMGAATDGQAIEISTSGAYAGTGGILSITANSATTTGVGLIISNTGTGMTSGSLLRITSGTTAAVATNGIVSFTASGNYTVAASSAFFMVTADSSAAGNVMRVSAAAQTTSDILDLISSGTGLTTGSALKILVGTTGAIATNGVLSVRATGAFTSTSNVGVVDVLASAVTGAGTVMRVKSSAAGQTAVEVMRVEAAGYTTGYSGVVMNVVGVATTGAAATTHSVLTLTGANTTGGNILQLSNNALTTGVGMLFAHTTSVIANGGSMIRLSSSSVDTSVTTGSILDIANTGATAAILVKITDSALLTGAAMKIEHATSVLASGASLLRLSSTSVDVGTTTGTLLDLAATAATTANLMIMTSATLTTGSGLTMTLNGLTTGSGLVITSSSADTSARGLIQLTGSSASATGTAAIRATMSKQSTHFVRLFTESTTGVTLWLSDGSTANAALAATTGDICFNAGSNKPEYCTNGGGSLWTALV